MSAQQYLAATTLAQALAWRAAHPQARWLAGGTDVLVQLRQGPGSAALPSLIDITRVPELHGIWVDAGWLHLGAASSFAQIAASSLVAAHASALQQATLTVGGPAIRNMGTLGGNLCSASPAADTLPPLVVLQAQVELTSLAGTRCLPVADFVTGPRQTCLGAEELLTRISLPLAPNAGVQRFAKIGLRQSLAIAVVSLAGLLVRDAQGHITSARFAWGSVGPVVQQIPELEALFLGQITPMSSSMLREALQLVQQNVHPISDLRASADYRRAMAAQLLADFLATTAVLPAGNPPA